MSTTADRGVIGMLIGRGEGKFALLKLALQSTLAGQVCKTRSLSRASLYAIFSVNRLFLYQAVVAASNNGKYAELDISIP